MDKCETCIEELTKEANEAYSNNEKLLQTTKYIETLRPNNQTWEIFKDIFDSCPRYIQGFEDEHNIRKRMVTSFIKKYNFFDGEGSLSIVSGERIWSELKKILSCNYAEELMLEIIKCNIAPYCGLAERPNTKLTEI
uniref:PolyA_pol_RNAbd domain-containing protein n=1 Tax=Glossina brevipalpis TaxID=37001 RepID=A0A1A9WV88_9MUSC